MEKKFSFDFCHYDNLSELDPQDSELVDRAKQACQTAYAPYSKFRVGAAARLKSGKIIAGSNQESEVFPSTLCAERTLLYYHGANMPDDPIVTLAIASVPGERECYPCGGCRQTINDVQKRQGSPLRVIMCGDKSCSIIDNANYLLPFTFIL